MTNSMTSKATKLTAAALLCLSLSGCVVVADDPYPCCYAHPAYGGYYGGAGFYGHGGGWHGGGWGHGGGWR